MESTTAHDPERVRQKGGHVLTNKIVLCTKHSVNGALWSYFEAIWETHSKMWDKCQSGRLTKSVRHLTTHLHKRYALF